MRCVGGGANGGMGGSEGEAGVDVREEVAG